MKDEEETTLDQEESGSPLQRQKLLEYLANLWQCSEGISPKTLQEITCLAIELPRPYRTIGLKAVAEYVVSSMNLHFLAIVALLRKKGKQEEIGQEEEEGILEDVLSQGGSLMAELNRRVQIRSLADLANLNNVSVSLRGLYRTSSAEEARMVLYELPKFYTDQLIERGLLTLG